MKNLYRVEEVYFVLYHVRESITVDLHPCLRIITTDKYCLNPSGSIRQRSTLAAIKLDGGNKISKLCQPTVAQRVGTKHGREQNRGNRMCTVDLPKVKLKYVLANYNLFSD
jgi:hypothetical protein